MFRNLRLYRLHSTWPASEAALSEQLEQAAFTPCGSFTERSAGWEAPSGDEADPLCRRVGGTDLLRLRSQTRVLPAAAVNEALEERVAEFRGRTERDPSRREKRQLKDEVYAELLPRALLKSERIRGCCLPKEGLIAVDGASEAQCERFLDVLRDALGSLKVTPLKFKQPVTQLISQVFLGGAVGPFRPGRECRMQDPAAGAAVVTWQDIELSDEDVRRHVRNGLKLTRLGMVFDEIMSFVIDQDAVVRKLRLEGLGAAEDAPDEDPRARLDAELTLLGGAVRRLTDALARSLGGLD